MFNLGARDGHHGAQRDRNIQERVQHFFLRPDPFVFAFAPGYLAHLTVAHNRPDNTSRSTISSTTPNPPLGR